MSEQEKNVFDEETTEEEVVEKPDDLKEGFIAESDPNSKMSDPTHKHQGPADDVVKKSLDNQLTALGKETARKLNERPKHKVVIPKKELSPDDHSVVVGTNGWNIQVKRDVPVMLPDIIIDRLSKSGENPTLVM